MEDEKIKQKDELEELFVNKEELIDKKLLRDSIMKYLKLTNEGEIIPEREFYNLPNTQKVVVVLLARKVLKIKNVIEEEEIGPTDISKLIGLAIGSVKTVFHATKDNVFLSIKGKYKIPNYSIKKASDYLSKDFKVPTKKANKTSKVRTTNIETSKIISETESVKKIKENLNRTEFPKIYDLKTVLERSLYLLKIVKKKWDIDGLTPPEISYVLTNIFRISVSRQAVTMALMNSKYVHRIEIKSEGRRSFVYKIMKPGEDYLDEVLTQEK